MIKKETKNQQFMQRALQLAALGGVDVAPNPKVGAVIVYNNQIIGEGYHQKYGEAHAEVNAIASVKDKTLLSQSTLYVTLEPCSHYGKTPPCADLIVKNKFKRVVVASLDSNGKVAGKGIQRIKDAEISVEIGLLEEEARELNKRFFTFYEKKRPYVILKWAETRDGFIDRLPHEREAGINWITGSKSKIYVHQWRSREQAIMVGWKTINNDNSQLTVRKIAAPSPHRFIIDPKGNCNPEAKVFTDGKPTSIITEKASVPNLPEHIECIQIEKINTSSLLEVLHQKNILSIFIEGGANTLTHFIADGLWDEAYQLIGDTLFETGISAPVLTNKTLLSQKTIVNDIVMHYCNNE